MPLDPEDTIAALASAPGGSERGIIRISGADTRDVVARFFVTDDRSLSWQTARVPKRFPGHMILPSIGVPVPAAFHYWPTNRSYTGQPSGELHLAGSPPILEAALEHICECGARMAGRGEFTMRAFLAGRLDLMQAEAVRGVIEAADHEELEKALSQLGGKITHQLRELRNSLIALLGDIEAGLDFVEEDIEFITQAEIVCRLREARQFVSALAADTAVGIPAGYHRRVVLAGLPNAGKSTLFNCLAGTDKALVAPVAGTTRDYMTAGIQVAGLAAELIDTAGWEDAADLIMERAQELRDEQVCASDLVIWCSAADLSADLKTRDDELFAAACSRSPKILRIRTRIDTADSNCEFPAAKYIPDLNSDERQSAGQASSAGRLQLASQADRSECSTMPEVSAITGAGIDALLVRIADQLQTGNASRSELLGTTAVRCRDSLNKTVESLTNAENLAADAMGHELISLEIRNVLQHLGIILGDVYTDDILDHIFSHFCIGK